MNFFPRKTVLAFVAVFWGMVTLTALPQKQSEAPLPPTYFSVLPVGTLPPLELVMINQVLSSKPINPEEVPPRLLFCRVEKEDEGDKAQGGAAAKDAEEEKKAYKPVGLSFNYPSSWIKNESGRPALELLTRVQKANAEDSYDRYTVFPLPKQSRGALCVLFTKNKGRAWNNPSQMVIPIEEFLNPDYTRRNATMLLNLLEQPVQFEIEGRRGLLKPGARVLIPVAAKDESRDLSFQIMKNGKVTELATVTLDSSATDTNLFIVHWNPHAKTKSGYLNEKVSQCLLDFPVLTPPPPAVPVPVKK